MAETVKGINIKIGADTTKYSKAMKDAGHEADSVGAKLSAFAGTAAKAIAAASAAAAAGAIALGKAVVDSYANYEQLVGGVDTLFKDASDKVQEYAESAYKTAGLSANDYMETVTSFSASLLQSLGGDTAAAADQANLAITDMSDNANKMGTDMASIQNAYQGFAKQNYTMLDNLKLGYGGTKEEMKRLIDDANKLAKAQGEAGDLTIDSYSDIIEAIHLVQTEMGITGTTAAEAEATITGSINMTKAAWENLLISLGTGEGVEENLQALMDSVANVLSNLQPVIERIIEALPEAVSALIHCIIDLIPEFVNAGVELSMAVLSAFVDATPVFVEAVGTVGTTLWETFKESIVSRFPEAASVFSEVETTIQGWMQQIWDIIDAAWSLIQDLWSRYGDAIMSIVSTAFGGIKDVISIALDVIKDVIDIFSAIVSGDWGKLWESISKLVDDVFNGIVTIVDTAFANLTGLIDLGLQAITPLFENARNLLIDLIDNLASDIKEKIMSIVDLAKNWGKDLIGNFIDGIKQKWEDLKSAVSDVAESVKDFIGFSEPKKGPLSNFHTFAPDMMQLYSKGIKENMYLVTDQMNMMSSLIAGPAQTTANLTMTTPVYLDGRVIATVVNQQLGVLL